MFFEGLVCLLGKHGVVINDINGTKTGELKIEIDFSEHDKIFEDKIAELEKELEEWKEEARVVKKKRDEQLKSFREGLEPYVDLLHMHETIADKNKKITELEKNIESYKQAFEDKCKDYDFTSELLNKYVAENESLEKRIQELDTIDTIRIDENRELKQRIAELESRETEKPTKYTTVIVAKEINGQTYVTLDDFMSVVNDLQAEIGT